MRRRFILTVLASLLLLPVGTIAAAADPIPRSNLPESAVAGNRTKTLPMLSSAPHDSLTRARVAGKISDAEYALLRAESLFHPRVVERRFGPLAPASSLHASAVLRDLALRLTLLHGSELARAHRILARPTDGGADPLGDGYTVAEAAPVCTTNVCVHYVASTSDAPDLTDVDVNSVPDYVDQVSSVMEAVWQAEVTTAGYRAPKSDLTSANNGGNSKVDVYLANIGIAGLYGYCTSDDPNLGNPSYQYWDYSAYCVLDNDFSAAEFPPPGANGTAALEVTAAHEFFHAAQAAYDWFEDGWFMEGTATWMEDQVYDAINDNRQYLPAGALGNPAAPVDKGTGITPYGNWVFWQFLTEYFQDPTIVRDTWAYADGSLGGPDGYSTQALSWAVADRSFSGTSWRLRWAFADFGAANSAPRAFYAEGSAGSYPTPPVSKTATLTGAKPKLGWSRFVLDHLTDRYIAVKPGSGVQATAKLKIVVDGPTYSTGTEASAVVFRATGRVSIVPFSINSAGDGVKKVPFGKGAVAKVIIVLTNASTRFANCWANSTPWSCSGVSRDDNRSYWVAAQIVQ